MASSAAGALIFGACLRRHLWQDDLPQRAFPGVRRSEVAAKRISETQKQGPAGLTTTCLRHYTARASATPESFVAQDSAASARQNSTSVTTAAGALL